MKLPTIVNIRMKTTTSTNQRKIVFNLDEIAHHSKYKNENININKPTKDSVEFG